METEFNIAPYSRADFGSFRELFGRYFSDDLNIELTDELLNKTCTEISQRVEDNIVFLDLLWVNGTAAGFINYQIDSPRSDWCEREGWGFIRELHVAPAYRKMGLGKRLVAHSEGKLAALSASGFYLTSDEGAGIKAFWGKMGYQDSGELSPRNHSPVFIK